MSLIPSIFGSRRTNVFNPFALDIWDPLDGFFNAALSNAPSAKETTQFVNARIDWKESPEAHVFKADLPGLKKEEVKVEVEEGNILQISGERSKEQEEKNDKWHCIERSSGKFLQRFRLPDNAKMDQLKASMENGVLTVTDQNRVLHEFRECLCIFAIGNACTSRDFNASLSDPCKNILATSAWVKS